MDYGAGFMGVHAELDLSGTIISVTTPTTLTLRLT